MNHVREPRGSYAVGKGSENITLALPKELKRALAETARKRGQSVNAFVRGLIEEALNGPAPRTDTLAGYLNSLPLAPKKGKGRTWKRDDAYAD